MQDIRRKVYVSVLAEMTPTGYAQQGNYLGGWHAL